jgi:cyclase
MTETGLENHPKVRLIPRLDVKGTNVVKGIRFEGLRVMGSPRELAKHYYEAGADEIVFVDIVASLYGRNNILSVVNAAAAELFVPLTVVGGIRSVDDVRMALRNGADKVGINTHAVSNPQFIKEVAETFGSQCMTLSVEAKHIAPGKWEVYTDNGRERTGRDVLEWVQEAVSLGSGEILLTSVDCDGTKKGFDVELVREVYRAVDVPVIASGGAGSVEDLKSLAIPAQADGLAVASILHSGDVDFADLKQDLIHAGAAVRS